MKPSLLLTALLIALLWTGCDKHKESHSADLEEYYDQLDEELSKSDRYQRQKDARITLMKQDLANETSASMRREVLGKLISEYESYKSDSALYYVDIMIKSLNGVGDKRGEQEMLLKRADIMSHAGLFGDALSEMKAFPRNELDSTLLADYYSVYCALYQYMSEYNSADEQSDYYNELRLRYTDSLALVAPPSAMSRITFNSNKLINSGRADEAIKILLPKLEQYEPGTRSYAIMASILAYAYKRDNQPDQYKKYLTLSAISDVKSSTKENMSFRELAQALYDDGDLDRAKCYLQKSFDDANFYSARMRTAQSARMLPVIDTAYDAKQNQLQTTLKWLLILVGFLALILAVAIFFILKQMKKIRQKNELISHHNEELKEVSAQLRELNSELAATNEALKQSDSIKEETTSLFMVFSSLTIGNMERYQQMLHNLAVKGNTRELIRKVDNSNVVDQTLREFYNKFDDAILTIYPDFVEKINGLLKPDEQIEMKPGTGKLNTELRVLALIRIGIIDSEKIAEFLRCSLTTVYTYRSKIRKRALNPDTFETDIRK